MYRLFSTGTIGGGKKGGLHWPPCVCPASTHPRNPSQTGRSIASGLWQSAKPVGVELPQHGLGLEAQTPQVIEAGELQAVDDVPLVPQRGSAVRLQKRRDAVGHLGLRPIDTVIVVAQRRKRRQADAR